MLRKEITYIDFNDEEVTDTYYFNLTKAELIELEASHKGGLEKMIENIVASKDYDTLVQEFKKIILLSYGEKTPDGKRFVKNDEIREAFSQTAAFDALFMEIASNEQAAADFVNGIVPKDAKPDKPGAPPIAVKPPVQAMPDQS